MCLLIQRQCKCFSKKRDDETGLQHCYHSSMTRKSNAYVI